MAEAPENGKESSHSAHANWMNERMNEWMNTRGSDTHFWDIIGQRSKDVMLIKFDIPLVLSSFLGPKYEGFTENHEYCKTVNKCQVTLECTIHDDRFQQPSHTRIKIMSPTLSRNHISVWENGWQGHGVLATWSEKISLREEIPTLDMQAWLQSIHFTVYREGSIGPSTVRLLIKHFKDRKTGNTNQPYAGCSKLALLRETNEKWIKHPREMKCDSHANGSRAWNRAWCDPGDGKF
jgi:hypothetical protein